MIGGLRGLYMILGWFVIVGSVFLFCFLLLAFEVGIVMEEEEEMNDHLI